MSIALGKGARGRCAYVCKGWEDNMAPLGILGVSCESFSLQKEDSEQEHFSRYLSQDTAGPFGAPRVSCQRAGGQL